MGDRDLNRPFYIRSVCVYEFHVLSCIVVFIRYYGIGSGGIGFALECPSYLSTQRIHVSTICQV